MKWIIINKVIWRERFWTQKVGEGQVRAVAKQIHGHIFVDIGCNEKTYERTLKRNFDRMLTIDPNPRWAADLRVAISDRNGTMPFYLGDGMGGGDSLVPNPHINGENWVNSESFEVSVRTFDSLAIKADLVKIDVEGAEFEVIAGMVKYLPKNVIVEVHDERRRDEFVNRMADKGYYPRRIDEAHWLFSLIA